MKNPEVGGEQNPRTEPRSKRRKYWQRVAALLMAYDLLAVCVSYFLALLLRFDGNWLQIPAQYLDAYCRSILPYALCCIVVFHFRRLYSSIWRFASYVELAQTLLANGITIPVQIFLTAGVFGVKMPLSYYVWGAAFQLGLMMIIRFGYRFVKMEQARLKKNALDYEPVMLVGAGNAGQMILREINQAEDTPEKRKSAPDGDITADRVVCIIDDDPNTWNRFVEGVPVVGGRDSIPENVVKYGIRKIFLTIPSASVSQKKEILDICVGTGCKVKQLPGIYQLVRENVTLNEMEDVSMEDLLGREPIRVDLDNVFRFLRGKTILVTGGGGSIGSELCRQIAGHEPKKLIIFDVYENNAYALQLELREQRPDLDLVVLIGSVRDSRKLNALFAEYRPDVVYHAAAHKHVPLMEDSPCEAIKNNTIGTYKTAYAAMLYGCERFVLISTDKAVNPTSVMGASKCLCEMIIQSFDAKIKAGRAAELPQLFTHGDPSGTPPPELPRRVRTEYVAVRFGNVLGSNGSVIPIFKEQIEKGGPVTVTHPDIIRYFMTIPEAVSLVLLAGTYAKGGEIFVLDLGSPVKIDTLARNLIRLSGYRPDVDIKIEYTGLRPGEKLYEEMLMAEEGLQKTQNNLIFIGHPIQFDMSRFFDQLRGLMDAAYRNADGEEIRRLLAEAVSTYRPAQESQSPEK